MSALNWPGPGILKFSPATTELGGGATSVQQRVPSTNVSNRSLVAIAVGVWSVAVLLGMFVGLPTLLTLNGIGVNAGLIIEGATAVGTVGTLIWAVVNGLNLRRQADYDRRQADVERRLDQARRVCGWATAVGQLPQKTTGGGPRLYSHRLNLSNSSPEPVHELVAYLVWVQGSGPRTGEEMEAFSEVMRMRAIIQVLPPGNFSLILDGPSNAPMQGRLGVEIAFTDGAGRHWVRRVPSAKLESLDIAPVEHYKIGRPLPPYDQAIPWA